MTWRTAALLMLAGVFAACSSEGGSRGSGISTLVRGNVASVQTVALQPPLHAPSRSMLARLRPFPQFEPAASANTALEGIQVIVEGTNLSGTTDASGNFSIRGDFEGMINLVFQRSADALMAQMQVTVPASGTLTLNDISIDPVRGAAAAASQQADFDGIITDVNCGGSTITMKSVQQNPGDLDRYWMQLDTSTLQDSHGKPLTCGDLRTGQQVMIRHADVTDGIFRGGLVQLVS